MSIVVVGCGRSGTNMALEILHGNPKFEASNPPEDKKVFKRGDKYGKHYLTKCDTIYFGKEGFVKTMHDNLDMKIIWTIRDPRDMIMSKLRRGVPESEGGDCKVLADDATPEGAMFDIRDMTLKYQAFVKLPDIVERIMLVKMEDMLLNTEGVTRGMCSFFGVDFEPSMCEFWKRMRVSQKARRYHGKDMGQVRMWENWRKAYGGWLVKQGFDMEDLFEKIQPICGVFGYAP